MGIEDLPIGQASADAGIYLKNPLRMASNHPQWVFHQWGLGKCPFQSAGSSVLVKDGVGFPLSADAESGLAFCVAEGSLSGAALDSPADPVSGGVFVSVPPPEGTSGSTVASPPGVSSGASGETILIWKVTGTE